MRTRSELEALAARHGWKPHTLNAAELAAMSSTEYEYHSVLNSKELERAVAEPTDRARTKSIADANNLVRIWTGKSTPEEQSEMVEAAKRFAANYPQFLGTSVANGAKIAAWFKQQNARPDYDGFVRAFEQLTFQNQLTLSMRALGKAAVNGRRVREIQDRIMRERKIRNDRVAEAKAAADAMQAAISELPNEITYISDLSPEQTKLILSPATAQQQFSAQSAEEFKAEHLEAFTRPAGYFETKAVEKVILSAAAKHPEVEFDSATKGAILKYFENYVAPVTIQAVDAAIDALNAENKITLKPDTQVEGQVVRYTDLGGNPPSYIETSVPTKTDPLTDAELRRFNRKKLELTSDGLMAECKENPRFRMWLDGEL